MTHSRKAILTRLIHFDEPLEMLQKQLSEHPWDSVEDIVILSADNICNVIQRYINGEISEAVVEHWANAIECREDIGFGKNNSDLSNIIHCLANPLLEGKLTKATAFNLLSRLNQTS